MCLYIYIYTYIYTVYIYADIYAKLIEIHVCFYNRFILIINDVPPVIIGAPKRVLT